MKIYSYTGVLKYDAPITKECKRRYELMKEDYIYLSFTSLSAINFELGDYIDDELFGRFIITDHYTPTLNIVSGGYKYELTFTKEYYIFKNHNIRYSANNEVSWVLTGVPEIFRTIMLQNINGTSERLGLKGEELAEHTGNQPLHFQHCVTPEGRNSSGAISSAGVYEQWNIVIEPAYNTKVITLSFNNTSILDAFSQLARAMDDGNGVDWWVEGNVIYFGKCEDFNGEDWSGRNTPILLSTPTNVENISVSNGKEEYATRIIPFGSTNNISKRYRKELRFKGTKVLYSSTRTGGSHYYIQPTEGASEIHLLDYFSDRQKTYRNATTNIAKTGYRDPQPLTTLQYTNTSNFTATTNFVISADEVGTFRAIVQSTGYIARIGKPVGEAGVTGGSAIVSIVAYVQDQEVVLGSKEVEIVSNYHEDLTQTSWWYYSIVGDAEITGNIPEDYVAFNLGIRIGNITPTFGGNQQTAFRWVEPTTLKTSLQSTNGKVSTQITFLSGNLQGQTVDCVINKGYYSRTDERSNYIEITGISQYRDNDEFTFQDIIRGAIPFEYFYSLYDNESVKYGVVTNNLMLPNEPCYKCVDEESENYGKLYRDSELTTAQKSSDAFELVYNGKGYIDIEPNTPISKVVEKVVVFDSVYPTYNSYAENVEQVKVLNDKDSEGDLLSTKTYYYGITDGTTLINSDYILDSAQKMQIFFGDCVISGEEYSGGSLNGMAFDVDFETITVDGVKKTRFIIIPSDSYSVSLPNDILYPSIGDGYSMVGCDTSLFSATLEPKAEVELLRVVLEYIALYKKDKNTYQVSLMSDYMYQQMGYNTPSGTIHEKFVLGTKIAFDSSVIFDTDSMNSRVIGVEYCLDYPYDTPKLTIGKTTSYSRLGAIETSIENLKLSGATIIGGAAIGGSGSSSIYLIRANDTTPATDRNTFSALRIINEIERRIAEMHFTGDYISKVNDDTAEGRITFNKGIEAHDTEDNPSIDAETINAEEVQTSGDITSGRDVLVDRNLDVTGNSTVGGNETISGNLQVKGNTTLGDSSNASTGDSVTINSKQVDFGNNEFIEGQQGARIWKNADGSWKLEVDYLKIHKKLEAEEVEIMKTSHIGGKLMQSAANMIVSEVWVLSPTGTIVKYTPNGTVIVDAEAYASLVEGTTTAYAYRLFFSRFDGEGNRVSNLWRVNDQAYCETFNLVQYKDEYGQTVTGNRFYWYKVWNTNVSVDGNDNSNTPYITVGAVGASGSVAPMIGDNVVQLGNTSDTSRQGAIVLAAMDSGSSANVVPYIRLYKGINSFSLPTPFIQFSPTDSWIDGTSVKLSSTGSTITTIINNLTEQIEDVSEQLDESFAIWQSDTTATPTLQNEPASNWTDTATRRMHIGDFYLASDGFCWIFKETSTNVFQWVEVNDQYLTAYVNKIGEKARVYTAQPTTYQKGDCWILGNTTLTISSGQYAGTYTNVMMVCFTDGTHTTFAPTDWKPIGDYASGQALTSVTGRLETVEGSVTAGTEKLTRLSTGELSGSEFSGLKTTLGGMFVGIDKVTFDTQGKITNFSTSGIVTIADFANKFAEQFDISKEDLIEELQGMFVGSSSVVFDTQGNITNFSRSGLATTDNFATLFAQSLTDGVKAQIAVYIADHKSELELVANDIKISSDSGSINFGDYFKLVNGNVWMQDLAARNITITGAFNNTWKDINSDNYSEYVNVVNQKHWFDLYRLPTYIICKADLSDPDSPWEYGAPELRLPCIYRGQNNNWEVVRGYKKDGDSWDEYSVNEIRSMVGKRYIFVNETGQSIKFSTCMKNANNTYTDQMVEISDGCIGVVECKLAEWTADNFYETIYWEVFRGGQLCNVDNEE